jgi:hypothetical protein
MTTQKRRSDRCGRAPLRSPGRPAAGQRENYQRFWASIAAGGSTEDAAIARGRCYRRRSVTRRGWPVVSEGGRHATVSFFAVFKAPVGPLSSVCQARRDLWRPTLVILDEVHIYCPERGSGDAESTDPKPEK